MKKILLLVLIVTCYSCLDKPNVTSDCDYIVTEYNLSQNRNGKWAIINNCGEILGYGYCQNVGSYGFYNRLAKGAMIFDDSCSAKGLLKQYIEDRELNTFN